MSRKTAWGFAALVVAGCQTGEVPQRGAQPEAPKITYATPEPASERRIDVPRPEREVDVPTLGGNKEVEARDLGEELEEAVGVPLDCVRDYQANSPTKIRVSVSATVRPTGMVITPSVYGYGLSAEARKCIEERVSLVVLPPLDKTVSETVSTIVEIDYEPPVIVEADPGTPEPVLRNTREPLPKRPEVAPSGRPIQEPTSRPISGGFDGGRPIQEPTSKKVRGPKPRPIDGYTVDENAQDWR